MDNDEKSWISLALLLLALVALAGMLLGRWELVLYPSIGIVGALLAVSMGRRTTGGSATVVGYTGLVLALFALLHAMGVADPDGEGLVLGWDPMTAIYLFVLGPTFVLLGLIYAFSGSATGDSDVDQEVAR